MNYYINNSTNCHNTIDSFSNVSGGVNISNHYTDQQLEVIRWLSPLEPRVHHQDIQSLRADNVGNWLLETDEFQRWRETSGEGNHENAALFCYGGPGVGKTYLSSLVTDRLGDEATGQPDAVACFYFDFAAQKEQTPANMLGSLLKQIVRGLDRIPEDILQAFKDQKKVIGGRRLRVPEIVRMLQTVTCSQRTFICVDALDECAERHRPKVLDYLRKILEKSEGTRIFITGRQHICDEIEWHLPGKASMLPIKPDSEDIRGYIRMRLSEDAPPGAMDSALREEITKSLNEKFPESFLLVSITLDSILRETTVHSRRKKLAEIAGGSDLKDAYGSTLERIKEQGGEREKLGVSALMWISHSERPLRPDELLHAVTVEIESTEPTPENTPSLQELVSYCLGLVTFDKRASRVRLIHSTLREYLYTRYPNAHSKIAEICLTYLNFQGVKDLSPTIQTAPESAPFLQYCSLYWGVHAKRETSLRVMSLALDLFDHFENHLSTNLLLMDVLPRLDRWSGIPMNGHLVGFTGLHCASLFGIFEIAKAFTQKKGRKSNKRDFLGLTPLMWAAIFGQEQVVELLLQQSDIHPNKADKYYGRTALSWAAEKGHDGVVSLFLGLASRHPDGTDGLLGETPPVANFPFGKRYVNLERQDKSGRTPLSRAAGSGCEGVVKLLLGHDDINPNRTDKRGWTPLMLATRNGREGTVKLLLERKDVNPNTLDQGGQTPLSHAAVWGREQVVKLLLARGDISPDRAGKRGWTPLLLATQYGHEGVVKLLLECEGVNPNTPDDGGQTPLSHAATRGREQVVSLLLGRDGITPDRRDNSGRTPLLLAASHGHEGAVKLLLEREDVDPNIQDNLCRTPLSWASRYCQEGAVKLLLENVDVDPNIPDKHGQTPLSYATDKGYERVVELLREREDINLDRPERGERKLFALILVWLRGICEART